MCGYIHNNIRSYADNSICLYVVKHKKCLFPGMVIANKRHFPHLQTGSTQRHERCTQVQIETTQGIVL